MRNKTLKLIILLVLVLLGFNYSFRAFNFNPKHQIGDKIDSLNGVTVFYNGGVNNSTGRNLTQDKYNLGIKYQCVEFVKRYYYEVYHHKMPDAYGNAKDFFDKKLKDGEKNNKRDLLQFTNPSKTKPENGDLLIYSPTLFNRFGHVAIIAKVESGSVEIIQQNPGPFASSHETYELKQTNQTWKIENPRIWGWLRKDTVDQNQY